MLLILHPIVPVVLMASVCVLCAFMLWSWKTPRHREGCAYAWYVCMALLCRLTQESRKKFPHQKSRLLYGIVLPYHRTTFKMLLKPELKIRYIGVGWRMYYVCPLLMLLLLLLQVWREEYRGGWPLTSEYIEKCLATYIAIWRGGKQ